MRRIFTTLSEKWPEYLVEILVITIGILGAFALNNWNESKTNDRKRSELAQSLLTEFTNNLSQLDTVIHYNQVVLESGLEMLDVYSAGQKVSQSKIDTLISNLAYHWTFDPKNGALRSGISSGDIHLSSNKKLLENLFAWEDDVKDAKEDEGFSYKMRTTLFEVLERNSSLYNSAQIWFPALFDRTSSQSQTVALTDPELENKLVNRVLWVNIINRELVLVRSKNLEIIHLLEEELKNS